jgi:N-acetylmuramoyl-L-alanine amidase
MMMTAQLASSQTSPPLMVKPQAGEGIQSFLIRNGLDPAKNLTTFIELNAGKFGKDNGLLAHNAYLLPTTELKTTEPLLGENYKEIVSSSSELAGTLYFLISGHGGPDPGASGVYGDDRLDEDEYAYDITLRLGKSLMEKGAKVIFVVQDTDDGIRDDKILKYDNDETCMGDAIPLEQVDRLRQRVNKVNQLSRDMSNYKFQRSISIHLDSRSHKEQTDVFFYYHHISQTGKLLANTLRQTLAEKYSQHQPNRGFNGTVSTRPLYEVKFTRPVSVFIELGNIRNFRDQQRFILNSNRQALATWICDGLVKEFNITSQQNINTLKK